jgi:hypothetical protein
LLDSEASATDAPSEIGVMQGVGRFSIFSILPFQPITNSIQRMPNVTDKWSGFLARILSAQDKLLFEEASRSARAGALRAAYIMVWISCAESLKRKFKELAPRDGIAKQISGECERRESAHQSVDHFLLEKGRDYGLMTAAEFTKLEQVYVCRSIYGHPYELGPSEANLISAATDIVDLVLAKATKLRHGYLSSQIEHLTTKRAFLDNTWAAVERFAQEVAQKCDATLHWWFLEKLWEKAESISADRALVLFFKRAVWFTTAYLRQISASIPKPWSAVGYMTRFPTVVGWALVNSDLFSMLDEHSKDVVFGTMIENSRTNLSVLPVLKELIDGGGLDERMRQRFQEEIDAREIEDLATIRIDPNLYIHRVLKKLKTHDWYIQNPAVEVVKSLGEMGVASLIPDLQLELGNNILQAAEGQANRAVAFLSWAADPSRRWPRFFVEGVISECFVNDLNQIRFKKDHLNSALILLNHIDEPGGSDELLKRLVERINKGKLKRLVRPQERDEAIAIVREFATANPSFAMNLEALLSATTALAIPAPFAH